MVRTPGGSSRPYTTPQGCGGPDAITRDVVVVTCVSPAGPTPVLVRLSDGRLTPVRVPGTNSFAYTSTLEVGATWMRVVASTNPFGVEPQGMETTALVNRTTGQVIGLGGADPYGPRVFFDLDRVSPARRLCSPLRRTQIGLIRDDTKYAPITYVDRSVLTENLDDGAKSTLQRCGRRKPERIAGGFRGIVLGKGLAAYTSNKVPRKIVLRSLASGRTWSARWLRYSSRSRRYAPGLAMAGRQLVLSLPPTGGPPGTRIYETRRMTPR